MHRHWFEDWFDSPYYHILYKHRDEDEARHFLDNLLAFMQPPPGCPILDLACGRGRHAVYLSTKGFDVTGLDLSPANIAYARRYAHPRLHFDVHDMRHVYRSEAYTCIFNLFTSFGYFASFSENEQVLRSVKEMLQPDGIFLLDYLNTSCLRVHGGTLEKEIDGVHFAIRKQVDGDQIVKSITITDGSKTAAFTEKVKCFTLADFNHLFAQAGLRIEHIFGSYDLATFDPSTSERLILMARK